MAVTGSAAYSSFHRKLESKVVSVDKFLLRQSTWILASAGMTGDVLSAPMPESKPGL